MKNEISAIEPGAGAWLSTGSGPSPRRENPPDKPSRPAALAEDTVPAGQRLIEEKVEEINRRLAGEYRRLEYSFHERPDACVITLFDTRTGEVIKQIPCEKILDMATAVWDRFGILVNEER